MYFSKITLKNFRQFRDTHSIDLSPNKTQNVTVIIGMNGAGKTTLLQSIRWCLYGEANLEFSERLYNKQVFDETKINDIVEVEVSLDIQKDGNTYIVKRAIDYVKTGIDRFQISKKSPTAMIVRDESGNTEFASVNDILRLFPQELSSYFLFDGERMKHLSESTQQGKDDIRKAVTNILGVDVLNNATLTMNAVIRKYKSEKVSDNSARMNLINKEITKTNVEIDRLESKEKTLLHEIEQHKKELGVISNYLEEQSATKEKHKTREELEKRLLSSERNVLNSVRELLSLFSENGYLVLLPEIMGKAKIVLENLKVDDKAIVGIDSKAIHRIIELRKCICGTHIYSNSIEERNLINLLNYVPPKSLSTLISSFKNNIIKYEEEKKDFQDKFQDKFRNHMILIEDVNETQKSIALISDEIKGLDTGKIKEFEDRRSELMELISSKSGLIGENRKMILAKRRKIDSFDNEVTQIQSNSGINKLLDNKISLCNEVLNKISGEKKSYEDSIRKNLQEKITEQINKMFTNKRSIHIDKNYEMKFVSVDNSIEAMSEGEKVVASFATVSGILEVAQMEYIFFKERYPLVMDAPFAKLDSEHRKSVAKFVPDIAEQIILFTVDSQWDDKVYESMKEKISRVYKIRLVESGISYVEDYK